MKQFTYETIVHKANIPLAAGESLSQFSQLLSTAMRAYMVKKLGGGKQNAYSYLVETYADTVVTEMYTPGDGLGTSGCYKFYAVPYTRDKDGTFNFGKTTEVIRVSTFQPLGQLPVVSNTTGESTADASTITSTKSSEPAVPENWVAVDKAMWNGLL